MPNFTDCPAPRKLRRAYASGGVPALKAIIGAQPVPERASRVTYLHVVNGELRQVTVQLDPGATIEGAENLCVAEADGKPHSCLFARSAVVDWKAA